MDVISTLIIRKLQGVITPPEQSELDNFAAQSESNKQLVDTLLNHETLLHELKQSYRWLGKDVQIEKLKEDALKEKENARPGILAVLKPYVVAAAAVALIIVGVRWLLWDNKQGEGNHPTGARAMTTLTTGSGESRNLQLSDGSSIILNSASSVQYPGNFSGPERAVTLFEGEVHCEIAKDHTKPFRVHVRALEVEVRGTKFDISAYKDDGFVRVTLLEGKVLLKLGKDTMPLNPGEQAIWAPGRKLIKIPVDSVAARARTQGWKENSFKWLNEDVRTVLTDIAHWYGYKIIYKTNVSADPYNVTILRSQSLNKVLERVTGYSGLKFKVDSGTITVFR